MYTIDRILDLYIHNKKEARFKNLDLSFRSENPKPTNVHNTRKCQSLVV